MNYTKNIAAAVAAILLGAASGKAGDIETMPFLRIVRDPAAAAVAGAGRASISTSSAYSALDGKVATTMLRDGIADIGAAYQMWAPDGSRSDNFMAGASFRINDAIAVSAALDSDNYKKIGDFSPSNLIVGAGVSARIMEGLYGAVNMRYASQKLWKGISYNAWCVDAMLLYRALPELSVTAGLSTLGPKVKGDSGSYPIPASLVLAGDWDHSFGRVSLRADADMDYYLTGRLSAAGGLQAGYADLVFVRCGYRWSASECALPSHFAVGAGVKTSGLSIDFAYLMGDKGISGAMTVGLGFSF